jgi:hypothetical protein
MNKARVKHALIAGAGAALAYTAAAAAGSDPRARLAGRAIVLGGSAMGLMAAGISTNTRARLNAHIAAAAPAINLQANGGTIGGNVTVQGDHHVQGSLYGVGSVLTIGDQISMTDDITTAGTIRPGALTSGGVVTGGQLSSGGTIGSGATITSGGNFATSGNVNCGTVNASGPLNAVGTTGTTLKGLEGTTYSQSGVNAIIARLNDFITALG